MKQGFRCAAALLLLLSAGRVVHAQEGGLAFLRIGTNAAALGMGEAYAALGRGAFATYWNPAGLGGQAPNMAAVTHHIWIEDVRMYTLAARFQAGRRGGLGLAVTANTSGDLEARQQPGPAEGTFGLQYASAGLSYGYALGPLRLGATAKYLTERVYTVSTSGYAFDFGAQASFLDGDVTLGLVAQHLGRMEVLEVEATQLPRTFRAGAAVRPFRIRTRDDDEPLVVVTLAAEVAHRPKSEKQTQLHLGAAAEFFDFATVRLGLMPGDDLRQRALGFGLGLDAFRFDYAFLPFRDGFGHPGHVLTLEYLW